MVYATQFGLLKVYFDATGSRAGIQADCLGSLVMSTPRDPLFLGALSRTGIAYLGAEVQVKGPTFVNDTLQVIAEVTEARTTSSGDRGIVTTRNEVFNQDELLACLHFLLE